MPIKHNYLTVPGTGPTADVTASHEIVINEVDGTLWSKDEAGAVIQLAHTAPYIPTAPQWGAIEGDITTQADLINIVSGNTLTGEPS